MSHTTTSPAPPMKDMLKDMYGMVDSVLDHQGIGHAESLETLQKKSNAKFLQLNICFMMKAFDSIIEDQETGMNKKGLALLKQATTDIEEQLEMIKELKEENEKLKEEIGMSKLVHHQNMGLSEDLKKLKEQNEKLKSELNDFTSVFDGNVSMIKMKKENQKLQNEVADLNDENKNIIHELNESSDCMLKMKEENEKLKQGIKDLFLSFD
tara:strand:- start:233 stop:862 length:630 start_codon:yes stop_codon:yes gene_type:complete